MSINFGEFGNKFMQFETSKIVLLPVPFDGTSTWIKGSNKGPKAIFEASPHLEYYDIETNTEVYKQGIHTLKPIEEKNVDTMVDCVFKKTSEMLEKNKFQVLLGGEHSVSIGAIRAVSKYFDNLTVLQLDAHSDLRNFYENSNNNHACIMARAKEVSKKIVQIGIRSMDVTELGLVSENQIFFAHKIRNDKSWMQKALNQITENVYLTIDLDVFDPAFLPSTGTPEPGGMNWYEVMDFIKLVNKNRNIVAFDVVELCPNPNDKSSDFFAAKLVYKILSEKFTK